jgi:hypothetical protein
MNMIKISICMVRSYISIDGMINSNSNLNNNKRRRGNPSIYIFGKNIHKRNLLIEINFIMKNMRLIKMRIMIYEYNQSINKFLL